MAKQTESDWLAILDGVHRLNESVDPADIIQAMFDTATSLIPCEHASYDEVNLTERTTAGWTTDPSVDAQWPALQDAAAAYFHQHPVLDFYQKHPNAGVRQISDFIAPERFRETGLYRECYRRLSISDQLVMRLPGEPGREVGLTLNRSRAGFSERERRCLDLLRPHFQQAYRRRRDARRLHSRLTALNHALEAMPEGVMVVDANAAVVHVNRRGSLSLHRHFGVRAGDRLPGEIERWLRKLMLPLAVSSPPEHRLVLTRRGSRLEVTAVGPQPGGDWILRIVERSMDAAVRALEPLGLTPRQAEVLSWVARGRTNAEIAELLFLSPRTVQKHLEHVFGLLGVTSRTAAAAKASALLNA
jgi:DNA-binding CsgD family transcriptional regulator